MKKVMAIIIAFAMVMAMAVSAYADTYDWKSEPHGLVIAKMFARSLERALKEETELEPEDYSITVQDSSIGGFEVIFVADYWAAINAEIDDSGDNVNKAIFNIDENAEYCFMVYYSGDEIVDMDYSSFDSDCVMQGF